MKRELCTLPLFRLLIGALLFLSMASSYANGTQRGVLIGAQHSEYPDWFMESFLDIAEDAAEASAENKHVILMFDSEGCPYCYKMVEENFKHSPYKTFIQENFNTIALNIRGAREVAFNETLSVTEQELSRVLKVRFTPTILFLDGDNRTVLRLNGYRSQEDFKVALDFVNERAYENTDLVAYQRSRDRQGSYQLRAHPSFEQLDDLRGSGEKPLMVIFEETSCNACDDLHNNILSLDSTRELMRNLTVVRLDAATTGPIVLPDGRELTPAEWVHELQLSYRPGIVFFDENREVLRLDALRWTFHFQQALRYVGERQFLKYEKFQDFARAHREALLASGQTVDVREKPENVE